MKVPIRIPLARPEITDGDRDAVAAVLAGDRLALGPELERFEAGLARAADTRHGLALSSGTAALYVALRALGVGPGDEVVTVSFTFLGTVNAILTTGATPVLVEVGEEDFAMDPDALARVIGPRTRAIIVVHLFGIPADMDRILEAADGIPVIEDACEALGARYRDRPVGGLGTLGAFGFYPNKPVTTGEGGALVGGDAGLMARCRMLRDQGRDPETGEIGPAGPGLNFRMGEMAAALGASQLARLEDILARRRSVAEAYRARLSDTAGIRLPRLDLPERVISWFVYVVRVEGPEPAARRADIRARLAETGIETAEYFPAVHAMAAYRERIRVPEALPVTEDLASRCLALPFFAAMGESEVAEVAEALEGV